ncbi:MAG: fibronectin type III domain-containing protein [Chryseolinea sp.]
MKNKFTYVVLCLLFLGTHLMAQKVTLNSSMLSYYQGQGNSSISLSPLVDEQSLIVSPLLDNSANPHPQNVWIPSWGTTPKVRVDFGSTLTLSQVALYDSWNATGLTVKYFSNGNWVQLFTWDLSYGERWKAVSTNVSTSQLLFEFAGLNGQIGELAVFGSASTDNQAPSIPTGLASSNVTATGVTLNWSASSDNVAVTGYEIYRNGTLLSTVASTTAPVTGLAASTTYLFKVRAKDAANNFSAFSNEISVTTSQTGGPCSPGKLTLTSSMITGTGNVSALVDEQSIAGNPSQGSGGAPSTAWHAGWNSALYPASAVLNFGSSTTINGIYLRDINDSGPFTIEVGTPGNWSTIISDNLTGYMSWNQHNVNVTTQYLRFTMGNWSANVAEVVIYGCSGTVTPDTTPPAAVTTLAAGTASNNSVQISWSSTGDDGNTGTATAFDVRYSTSAITAANFASASQASGEPTPLASGASQSFLISGLAASTTYYFAMKVLDEVNNTSSISNVVSKATTAVPASGITVDKFMGTNAFVDDPINRMQAVGFIREYHNWNWDEGDIWSGGGNQAYPGYPNNQMKWAPSEAGGGGWNFDTFYNNVLAGGLTISPVIQGSVAWLHGGTNFPGDDKPIDEPGASTTNPNSYEKKAHHMFQFAARYGSTVVADNKLTLAPGQPRNSGLGLVKYVEDWNEQDKNWMGPNAQFSAQEYAAMASANYDGHANTMHQGTGTFGVKNADPTIKMVMGGIFQTDLQYIMDMKAWFNANRVDHKFAADVINVHDYAWLNACGPCGGPAKSPEQHGYREKLTPFVQYRNQNLPGVEVWISEFGWDTNQGSSLAAPAIGPFDVQEVQGQWMVRAYLAFAAAGVDRAMQYMLRDVNPNDATHFSTSGLVAQKDDWTPKKSWYYVYTMKNTLTNMKFIGEQTSSDPNILIYKFKDVNSSAGAYVVWAKTRQNYTVNNFSVSLPGASSATKIDMVSGDTDGTSSALPISAGSVSLNVTERPVYIKVNTIQ